MTNRENSEELPAIEASEAVEPQEASADPETQPEGPSELEQIQSAYAALNDKYTRLLAEYDNYRKRTQRERETIYPEATASIIKDFLAVADNFERALDAPCADAEYKKGAEITFKVLCDVFQRLNVTAFGEVGDPFDPMQHNAVMHVEDETIENSTVIEVFQKGYRIGDRVLRCAMVKVAN